MTDDEVKAVAEAMKPAFLPYNLLGGDPLADDSAEAMARAAISKLDEMREAESEKLAKLYLPYTLPRRET